MKIILVLCSSYIKYINYCVLSAGGVRFCGNETQGIC